MIRAIDVVTVDDDEDDDRGARLQTKPTAAVVDDESELGKRHWQR